VIAVTATDYADHLFKMANRGSHVAIAAPGVDILVANPGGAYKLESGTSFSAAFVSGVVALVLERKPDLTPDAVKKVLLDTAHDLGAKGRDDLFGAGLMDAFQAVDTVAKPADAALQVPVR
jgi:subtilisin family serine protease